jgi:anion-transporting  ArsA/GET3 family ATPase
MSASSGGPASLVELLTTRRALICAGAGGVGKTTVSASLALAAARLGRRVLVVTIDPSRRLAETLGVERHLPAPVALAPERLAALGVAPPGTLDAWMLDPGIVSDRTVEAFARTPDDARRLLANPVYQGLSRMTAGMHEYTAVEAMHTFVTQGRYDLVVLDTPPARNALRFLDAPRRVSAFLDRRIFEAFAPAQGGLIRRVAGGVVEKVLDVALGQATRRAVQEFFGLFGTLLKHLEGNQKQMVDFLRSDAVAFVLVTSPHRAAVEEALALEARCRQVLGIALTGRVLNQSLGADADDARWPEASLFAADAPSPSALAAALPLLTGLADAEAAEIAAHRAVAARLAQASGPTWVLPRLPAAASTLEALDGLVTRILRS